LKPARHTALALAALLVLGCRPYFQDEVSIRVNAEVTLAGTLSIPEGPGPFPTVVLVSGSGLQTRDHRAWGFPLFKKIADHLARRSVAVLRCDDRGFGRSTGSGSGNANNTLDFADDVLAQVAYLKTRSEVDPSRIGLLGISEGALVAAMVDARSNDVEFAILLAGPAVRVDRNLLASLELNLRGKGLDEETIAREVDLWDRIYLAIRRGEELSPLREELRDTLLERIRGLSPEDRAIIGNIERYAEDKAASRFRVVTSKWARFLVGYDPRSDQASMTARVLALYGGKDTQVPAQLNAPALDETFRDAGKTDYEIRVFDEANHLFQKAVTGGPDEYERLRREFLPGFLETLEAFIAESGPQAR
jgi:pimeloyl-ACP methyl ester carboxylesterase